MRGVVPVTRSVTACALLLALLSLNTGEFSATALTPGVGPVSMSVIFALTAPAQETGLIPPQELARYTEPSGTLSLQLDQLNDPAITVAIDPMIIASIRVLGSTAPSTAQNWLTRLETLPGETFLLPYADADLLAASRTGTLASLEPQGFNFALDTLANAPRGTELLTWRTTMPRIAWPSDEVGEEDLMPLSEAGYANVIVPDTRVLSESNAPLLDLGRIRGIIADTAQENLLISALTAPASQRQNSLEALSASLSGESEQTPGRGIVVRIPRGTPLSPASLVATMNFLRENSAVQFVPLGNILASKATTGTLTGGENIESREIIARNLAETAASETSIFNVLQDPEPLIQQRSLWRIALQSLAWQSSPSSQNAALSTFEEYSINLRSAIHFEQGSDALLLARNTDLRVVVRNTLAYPAQVRLRAIPSSPILRIAQRDMLLTIEAESTAVASIPVEAATNGEVIINILLEAPDGTSLAAGELRARVQAEWENLGTLIVVGVLLLLFSVGIIRKIRHKKPGGRV